MISSNSRQNRLISRRISQFIGPCTRITLATTIVFGGLCIKPVFAAGIISDLLIALESDGRTHMVQHTVATEGTQLTVNLPGSVIPQEVRFLGVDSEQFTEEYKQTPGKMTLFSGSAFARYSHQYGPEVTQTGPGEFALTTLSMPDNIIVSDGLLTDSSITWVFPSEIEIITYTVTEPETGRWVAENNTLTFHQSGPAPVTLGIEYRYRQSREISAALNCSSGDLENDACSPDKDADGIPDFRDVCLNSTSTRVSSVGCEKQDSLVLNDISFDTGKSYLDVKSRQVLDRVAHAIRRQPDAFFEIGTHTDNQGTAKKNQRLSQKRADAVRHYLMLRGVGPNSIRSTGYGENYPIKDNGNKQGRRANRRVELAVIK